MSRSRLLAAKAVRPALAAVTLTLLLGCAGESPPEFPTKACQAMEAEAAALLAGFAACRADADCALMSLSERLEREGMKRWPRTFECSHALRADADRAELVNRANAFIKLPSECLGMPSAAACTPIDDLEAFCDAGRGQCALRPKPGR